MDWNGFWALHAQVARYCELSVDESLAIYHIKEIPDGLGVSGLQVITPYHAHATAWSLGQDLRDQLAIAVDHNYILGAHGPLHHLFWGHSLDPGYIIGYVQVSYMIQTAQDLLPFWTDRKIT